MARASTMRSLASSSPWARYADSIAISTCVPLAVFAIASAPNRRSVLQNPACRQVGGRARTSPPNDDSLALRTAPERHFRAALHLGGARRGALPVTAKNFQFSSTLFKRCAPRSRRVIRVPTTKSLTVWTRALQPGLATLDRLGEVRRVVRGPVR